MRDYIPYDYLVGDPFRYPDKVFVVDDRYGTEILFDGRVVDYNKHTREVTIWTQSNETVVVKIDRVKMGAD